ncbi:MAG: CAP domain-containing protein [Lachnospiraceae bacterium]|nr:CAP domain-containing protein [Lachnospiraceae bacterium]
MKTKKEWGQNRIHKLFAGAAGVLLAASLLAQPIQADAASAYHQKEAKSMVRMINKMRKNNAWYRNENNKKVWANDLDSLSWDSSLEEIAKTRAKELSKSFSHTRPNGKSCFSLYGNEYSAMGENIAAGFQTAKGAFEGWSETNQGYSGQGHRRNMLGENFELVGIACFEKNGMRYWVQEFGSESSSYDDDDYYDYDDDDDDDYSYYENEYDYYDDDEDHDDESGYDDYDDYDDDNDYDD